MKKALQIPPLRALRSVSERTVVRGVHEGFLDRFCNDFAEVGIADLRRPRGRLLDLLRSGWGPLRWNVDRSLRQRARNELDRRHVLQALLDLPRTLRQFERPHRVARVHDERPIALEACRPRAARDLGADGGRPRVHHVADRALRPETAELPADVVTERFQRAPPRAGPDP